MKPLHQPPAWFEIPPNDVRFRDIYITTIDDVDLYRTYRCDTDEFVTIYGVSLGSVESLPMLAMESDDPEIMERLWFVTPAIREYVTAYLRLMS